MSGQADRGHLLTEQANPASSASFCAASSPLMSRSGSASAKPSFWASFNAASNDTPSLSIWLNMKLQVPFKMPLMRLILLPASASRSVLITGMPPATAAS